MTKMKQLVNYQENDEIYKGAEVIIEDDDRMDINEPIIQEKIHMNLNVVNNKIQPTRVNFLNTDRLRNVVLCGNLHAGKTSLIDYLVSTRDAMVERFTDHHILELDKKVSLMSTPISIQLGTIKTYQFNLLDLPGHSGTIYEYQNLQLYDGCCLVIDIIEGIQISTRTSVEYCVRYNIPFVAVFNKMDRLIVELKLPPSDAFQKIKVVLNNLNSLIKQFGGSASQKIHPTNNNIVFSSLAHGWCFSLKSFSEMYLTRSKLKMTSNKLMSILWGDYTFDKNQFIPSTTKTPVFVDFILEPLYKVYGIILGESIDHIKAFVTEINIKLPSSIFKQSPTVIAIAVLQKWIGSPQPLIDVISTLPKPNNHNFLQSFPDSQHQLFSSISDMDAEGLTIIQPSRIYYYDGLVALCRVLSGTLTEASKLRISANGQDVIEVLDTIYYPFSKSLVRIKKASAGDIVLVKVSEHIRAHTLMVDVRFKGTIENVKPFLIKDPKWLYIAIEPRLPSNLPIMLKKIVIITRIYPGVEFKVEDSGEYGLFGPNEFLMDCVLHDLRFLCNFDVRVSDPIAKLRETVMESSQIECHAISPNLKNVITTISEPMEPSLITQLHCTPESANLSNYWDELACASLWAFGPSDYSTCALLNDVVDDTREVVESLKLPLTQGFQWACHSGPLCDDILYGIKFKILKVTNEDQSQLPPTMRKSLFNSILSASPRFVEPLLYMDIICPQECFGSVSKLLNKRRGNVLTSYPIACTPLFCMKCQIPALDSFGCEVDIRMVTQGQAMVYSQFGHYQILESDPLLNLFEPITIEHLQPSPVQLLATDYMLKTRRRKGLGDEIVVDDSLKMLFNI